MPPPSDHEATAVVPTPVEVKMALINANHISNKTFVLNDFATKNGLHFLMSKITGDIPPPVEVDRINEDTVADYLKARAEKDEEVFDEV
ncbi:hypothetical protein AAFF_G00147440 [Aldrovandia affinis]|uniref:Uncharacterized protein n=1 Tax=Aldrovandia affinis TaxID=143900 RepID=A0AAD7R2Y6_9TELE|nr:hypothetical protein AAFF_G00147440 [Aldrovandia affinis]